MRSLLILIGIAAVAGCSEQDQVTSPGTSVGTPVAADAKTLIGSATRSPDARPTDQVGFTSVSIHQGTVVTGVAGVYSSAYAMCPAGQESIGGSFQFLDVPGTPPILSSTARTYSGSETGWGMTIDNRRAGALPVKFVISVICIS